MADARLGLLNYGIMFLIIVYIIVFVLWLNQGYLETEIAVGQIDLDVRGKSFFISGEQSYLVDAIDMTTPSIEQGALFVISRQEMVRQQRGHCGNPFLECDVSSDCPVDPPISRGDCRDGFCQELGWCPPLDPADTENTHIMQFENPENLTVWIRAAISFPNLLANVTYTTMHAEHPIYRADNPDKANAFYVWELFELAGVNPASVREDGCFLNIRMNWDCFLDTGEGCYSPQVFVKRLDVGAVSGFDLYDAEYIRHPEGDPTKEARFYTRMTGFRMLVSSKGTGYKVSMAAIVLQLSSGIALLSLSKVTADALMKYVLPEREHYMKYKEETTPDFSDLRDKITDEDDQPEGKKLRDSAKTSRYPQLFEGQA